MEIILRGVRGSIATPTPETVFYGGNTTCLEVRTDGGKIIYFDAGTGMRSAGNELPDSGECHVFISHAHADHMSGLWFFKPLHSPGWVTHLYLPEWMKSMPDDFYRCGFFPVPFESLRGTIKVYGITEGDKITIESGAVVEAFASCHPGGCMGYRVRADKTVFVYSGDYEIENNRAAIDNAGQILKNADIAVVDAMYDKDTYSPGWGHSAWEDWVAVAKEAGVRQLLFSHHDPLRRDDELDRLEKTLRSLPQEENFSAHVAREGMRLTSGEKKLTSYLSSWLFEFLDELAGYRDESAILDRILAKAREITNADAGTIYLVENDQLVFAYTHNDSLFSVNNAHKYAYTNLRVPINQNSIVGCAAISGQTINLADVRSLPIGAPYKFNNAFDRKTGFTTVSMLTMPFFDSNGQLLGVLQLINSLSPCSKKPVAFSILMEQNTRLLAFEVAGVLERSALERKGIYGILRMAAVHDPTETGPHAERVGAISSEIYQVWAERQGYMPDAIRYERSRLRLAAMLHDIGKVGVSDLILKKPGKLTEEEFAIMRGHTELGASILASDHSDIAKLAHDIALHHHQKWNGKGYSSTGEIRKLSGEDIPLAARITAIADVFDALVSPRCYKQPWSVEDAIALFKKEAGEHFDPEMVDCLCSITDIIGLIYERFPDVSASAGKDDDI